MISPTSDRSQKQAGDIDIASNQTDEKYLLSDLDTVAPVEIAENGSPDYKANGSHITLFVIVICINFIAQRLNVGSQIWPLVSVKLDWTSKEETEKHISVIIFAAIIGDALGSAFGAKLM